jgi:phage anti-repressor protein
MQYLIKIEQKDGRNTVSARELHSFLQIQTKFTTWIQRRIDEYGFVDNQDYSIISQIWETNNPKNPKTEGVDYVLTLDMAKELAMVEKNERGKQARRYFIECEKTLRFAVESPQVFNLTKIVTQAVQVCGSQAKLAKRIGVSTGTLSQAINGQLSLFSNEMLRQIEKVSRKIVDKGAGYDAEIIEDVMKIEDKALRMKLFRTLRKEAVL